MTSCLFFRRRSLAPAALAVLLAAAVLSAVRPSAALTPQELADVARVEEYLNGIETLQARFLQNTRQQPPKYGTFYLWRPGKMRLEYDPPVADFIVADGWFLFYWDADLRQQSSTPIGSSLADVILRENLRLSGDITVTDVRRAGGDLEVTVIDSEDPGKGRLTLVFAEKPLRLRQWRVVDAQGVTTTVALLNLRTGMRLDRDLFFFREPRGDAVDPSR